MGREQREQLKIEETHIVLLEGDITCLTVDAIVNATDHTFSGGGGVDLAIHKAAGPKLSEACRIFGTCPTGEARITHGYNLPASHVIHTVGPIYGQEHEDEAALLASCYRNCLNLAARNHIRTIAFPAISTGVYGYPKEDAARVVHQTVREYLNEHTSRFDEIIFVFATAEDFTLYKKIFKIAS